MKYIFIIFIFFLSCSNDSSENKTNIQIKQSDRVEKINNIEFRFYTNYQKALQEGIKYNKKLFIIFYTQYCGWCHKLKKEILESLKTQKILIDNYIPIFLDRDEKNSYPRKKYTVSSVPAIYITTSNGNLILSKRVGYYNQYKLRKFLKNFK